ncbi:MAG: DUF1934 domain-containing protein [Lachnospiraceae bacterium]|nr:DUF1934 domain-containing protein [Lachnospiraceae bacterium]
MNKDVLISIKGMHFDTANMADDVEVIQRGQYYKRGGNHYLIYDEPLEGSELVNHNILKFNDMSLSVTKKGPVTASMLFEESSKNLTNYSTPFGSIVVGLDTRNIALSDTDDVLKLDVNYSLDINYEFLADCNISIEARSSDSASI